MEEEEKRIHTLVSRVVTEYSTTQARQAIEKVKEHQEGKGCQCKNCTGTKVYEANSWLDWHDPDGKMERFEHDGKNIRTTQ